MRRPGYAVPTWYAAHTAYREISPERLGEAPEQQRGDGSRAARRRPRRPTEVALHQGLPLL
ncbi:MAG TPA: hypothetical protein PKL63_15340, partial [Dermatophilaceae bacterium]|nr:hypothetical protein [Dermatophilaceae bacterium]